MPLAGGEQVQQYTLCSSPFAPSVWPHDARASLLFPFWAIVKVASRRSVAFACATICWPGDWLDLSVAVEAVTTTVPWQPASVSSVSSVSNVSAICLTVVLSLARGLWHAVLVVCGRCGLMT